MTSYIARDFPERSTAMARGFGRVLDRATLGGGLVAVAIAVLVSMATRTRLSWELGLLAGAVLGMMAGLIVMRVLIPTRMLRAFEAFSWLGRAEVDRFEARTGSRVPVRRPDVERWLEQHPPGPPMQLGRVEILAYIGRLEEARAELEDVVVTGPELELERATLVQYIGWLTDGDPRIEALHAAVADLALDAHHRRAADLTIAVARARERFMRADPAWALPLAELRPALGSDATRVVLRDTWRPAAVMYLSIALVAGALASLLPALP